MKFKNPVVRGYYPDPSVCRVKEKYYMVCSSFHYFPGVPLFESCDLINWTQIGFCLSRKSQLPLSDERSSGGIYAPTIRYDNGRFYMVTTNTKTAQNFYVYTDDIYGEWSEPVFVEQDGIDPSLYFENGKAYFMSNGTDENGKGAIQQCEIDIKTGRKITESRFIWNGSGGRYLESPHIYKIGGYYYLMAAEGGTEYGHMVTYARGESLYGPFTPYYKNPVLTNRNLGGYPVQGVGHGDLVEDTNGNYWIYHLGFRQIDRWLPYHHLGREVFLMPVTFDENGWFTVGENGTTVSAAETDRIPENIYQNIKTLYNFNNTCYNKEWQVLREFIPENYIINPDTWKLKSTPVTIDMTGSPAFIGLHQQEFDMELSVDIKLNDGEAGVTAYMDENHHYDIAAVRENDGIYVILKLNIGDIKHIQNKIRIDGDAVRLIINSNAYVYDFLYEQNGIITRMGGAQTRYLSTEVAAGFTGVLLGLYSQNGTVHGYNEFSNFLCEYKLQ